MKKITAFAVMLAMLLAACNKDQKTVNKLDGVWDVRSASVSGSSTSFGKINYDSVITADEMYSMQFSPCKIKDDSCVGTMTGTYQDFLVTIDGDTAKGVIRAVTFPFTYIVSDKGGKLNLWIHHNADSVEERFATISEHKKNNLTLDFDYSGTAIQLMLEKRTSAADTTGS